MIEEVKNAILSRIKKAVQDESKSISPENLKVLADIVICFDKKPVDDLMAMLSKKVKVEDARGSEETL